MPRRARLSPPNVPLHLIQRGNNRQACFFQKKTTASIWSGLPNTLPGPVTLPAQQHCVRSKVTWSIHAIVQDAYDCDAVSRDAKVNQVPFNAPATIAWPNLVTCRGGLRRLRQLGKDRRQDVSITIGLLTPPSA